MPERQFKTPYPRAECVAEARKSEERWRVSLTKGKVYEVRGELRGMLAVLDDANVIYLYPKSHLRFLDTEPSE
jgi:hypothetical protein